MQTNTNQEIYKQTINKLNNLPDEYLDKMNEISRKQAITEHDIETEIELARKGK